MKQPEEVRLREIITIHYGKALKSEDRNEVGRFSVYGSNGFVGSHDECLVPYPTIIIGRKGSVGQITYAPAGGWPIDTTYFIEILDPVTLHLRYLFYALKWAKLDRWAITTSIPGLNRDDFYESKIPLPPLDEQRRIAAILDKADAVRRKRQEALRLSEDLLRSVFLDMFGDPVTNPKGWEVKELGMLLEFLTSGSRGWAKYYSASGKLFLRIQNVKGGRVWLDDIAFVHPPNSAEARRTKIQAGDVLLSITADLGRAAVVPEGLPEAHINQHLALLRLHQNGLEPVILADFLESEGGRLQFNRLDRTGVKSGLNFDDIRSIIVPVPSRKAQNKYLAVRKKILAALDTMRSQFLGTESLFHSLVQRAFRGEL